MSYHRDEAPDPTPRCPRCRSTDAVVAETIGPKPWFCESCLTAFTGSAHEAAHHAAIQLAEKAEREAAATALAEMRREREDR